jgi:hypothetical protein
VAVGRFTCSPSPVEGGEPLDSSACTVGCVPASVDRVRCSNWRVNTACTARGSSTVRVEQYATWEMSPQPHVAAHGACGEHDDRKAVPVVLNFESR